MDCPPGDPTVAPVRSRTLAMELPLTADEALVIDVGSSVSQAVLL
jgi:hypothetical protein